jgi:hypothetical protein
MYQVFTDTRRQVLTVLQNEWATYVERFQRLSPEERSAFLEKQGYSRLADLLAHIIGWWEVGYQAIENYLADPQYQKPQYNVDEFNAKAVASVQNLNETTVIQSFEQKRKFLLDWVTKLSDAAFENDKVVNQFNMELIGHLSDHAIPRMSV